MISILLPVKNAELYLEECLDSILSQTEKNWECLMVDDHSTDNSSGILRSYADKDQRFTYLKNDGNGIIAALRLAYKSSSGDLVTRMDSDDLMAPEKLHLLKLAIKEEKDLAVGLVRYFPDDVVKDGYRKYEQWLNALTSQETNFAEIYKECVIPSPCWMLKRIDLDACGAFESEVYPEDYDLCFRMRQSGLKVKKVPKVIHHWRDYSTRTSRTDDNYSDNRFIDLKVKYFLSDDYNFESRLILWGAGKKGKKIAQLLVASRTEFQWVCNNSKKIGLEIYGQLLEDSEKVNLTGEHQLIIAVANAEEQKEISDKLKDLPGCVPYYFC